MNVTSNILQQTQVQVPRRKENMKLIIRSHSAIAKIIRSLVLTSMLSIGGFLVQSAPAASIYGVAPDSHNLFKINASTGGLSFNNGLPMNAQPLRIAKNPTTGKAYVCDCTNKSVIVLDTSTGQLLKTIPLNDGMNDPQPIQCPQEQAFSPSGDRLYVVDNAGQYVTVITTSNDEVFDKADLVTTGSTGRDILVNGDYAYVANTEGQEVTVIHTTNGSITRHIAASGDPRRVAITPTGSLVFASIEEGYVTVVDTSTRDRVGDDIELDGAPNNYMRGIAVQPQTTGFPHDVYVTDANNDRVFVLDYDDLDATPIEVTVGVYPTNVTVTPDGNWACVSNQTAGTVTIINTTNHSVAATATTGAGAFFSVSSDDSTQLWVSNSGADSVSKIKLTSPNFGQVTTISSVGDQPFDMIYVP